MLITMDANAAWIRKLEDEVAQPEVQVGHTLDSKRRGKGPLNGCTRPSDGDRRSYNQKQFNKNRADQRLEKARKKLNDARKELAAEAAKKELAKKHDLSGHKAGVQAAALATRPEILPSDSADCDFEHQDCKTGVQCLFVNETALASRTVSPRHDGNCLQRNDPEARRCPDGPHGRHVLLGASDDAYDGTSATTTALPSAKPKPAESERRTNREQKANIGWRRATIRPPTKTATSHWVPPGSYQQSWQFGGRGVYRFYSTLNKAVSIMNGPVGIERKIKGPREILCDPLFTVDLKDATKVSEPREHLSSQKNS
ncbi:hypothetical protein MMC22_003627 [Lobaria immixta]|nr:hypothetical protein [Lobaria immixta]